MTNSKFFYFFSFILIGPFLCDAAWAQEWRHYGADAGGSKFSEARQINAGNISALDIAWQYRTGELGEGAKKSSNLTFEATPVLWDRKLYLSTGFGKAIALDAKTGEQVWTFDSELPRDLGYAEVASRGVTVWEDEDSEVSVVCQTRVFLGTILGQLFALDARSGKRCLDFGVDGVVDLHKGARPREAGQYAITSPPVVAGRRVVVGSAIGDNSAVGVERGIVRALDAVTGEVYWSFDPIPSSDDSPAAATWKSGREETGGGNAWAPLSIDVENGLVFVPTGSPSPDFFGGQRIGDGHYANSLVALSIETGEVQWFRQLIHHDVWDYDLPAQPLLVDLELDSAPASKKVAAVVQTTKTGMVFVFNRVTGEPLYPIEERPVPQGGVDGEVLSPTQPFSALPALVSHAPISEDDAFGFTPLDRRSCRKKLADYSSEGIFTPPSIGGTLMNPGYAGGSNWGGLSFDPESQIAVATVMELPLYIRLTPRKVAEQQMQDDEFDWEGYTEMDGSPYVMNRGLVASPLGVPCTAPPWGKLVALNLGTGEIAWQVPLGTIEDVAPALVPNFGLGTALAGGAITTAADLVLVAAAQDDYLRAFDLHSGDELWKGRLPAGGQATPMTYVLDGRQYVVIAAGGHGGLGTTRGDYVVAFALPE